MTADGQPPQTGTAARDTVSNRVGIVMAYEGALAFLRPLLGGREWDADPAHLVPLSRGELLRAHVAELNARSRKPLR
ncbi:hypothetical protein JJV70_05660 [Streptomyces sp. JJ66]|uniref:hypothetical protein n=1 Tax=Streptomyces sp. JJ66 TaxID=2803843 RepID=UPI001C596155|nr:hypothetical protein [Streptomyces sp. JJ66]MBW1601602.1 hypothetical protein [Streptomyces sp. JJ66]